MRVGVMSPNLLFDIGNHNAMCEDARLPWLFESLAKKTSLLFDKLFLTDNLDLTCEILGSSGLGEEDPYAITLRYLIERGLILTPQDLGYASGEQLLKENIRGRTTKIQKELVKIGNPSNDCLPGEIRYLGQPDIGDFEAHDGMHPRSDKGWNDPSIEVKKRKYESLLLRRNAAVICAAGLSDVTVVGRVYDERQRVRSTHPVWKVVFEEMPELDSKAPWEDVLDFRKEEQTQHLVRSLRRWIRKIVAEEWTEGELEDEIRELVFAYESHLRRARMRGGNGIVEILITGAAGLAEDIIKLRFAKISKLATAIFGRRVRLMQEEANAPGRELAIIPRLKERF
jgi:hypothetical protein